MKNIIFVSIVILTLVSCTSTREVMDSWLGNNKHDLIMVWGPPVRTASDGKDGEILIYAKQLDISSKTYWSYKMFWADSEGIIYHWMTQRRQYHPHQIDLNVYIRD